MAKQASLLGVSPAPAPAPVRVPVPVPASLAPPARPRPPGPAPAPGPAATKRFGFGKIQAARAQRVVLYGPGGIGKTTLACRAPGPVAVIDLDGSLDVLAGKLEGLDVRPLSTVATWQDLRDALHQPELWAEIKTIVIDSLSRAEALATAHCLKTIPLEKGGQATSIEGYGYGKGYRFVYEVFAHLLGDLDQHYRAGRNIVLTAHDCTAPVPNPDGADYIRWEPRLQNQQNGNIRFQVKEWPDHLLCVRYDVNTDKDGKAKGSGTRTIYPAELPTHMAKSRTLNEPIVYFEGDDALWKMLFP